MRKVATSGRAPASSRVAESRGRLNRAARAHFPSFAFYEGLALVAVCFAAFAVSNCLSPSARKSRGCAPPWQDRLPLHLQIMANSMCTVLRH
jgi:hypothetical protein